MSNDRITRRTASSNIARRHIPANQGVATFAARLLRIVRKAFQLDRSDLRLRSYRIDDATTRPPRGRAPHPHRIEVDVVGLGEETVRIPIEPWRPVKGITPFEIIDGPSPLPDPLQLAATVLDAVADGDPAEPRASVLRRVADDIERSLAGNRIPPENGDG